MLIGEFGAHDNRQLTFVQIETFGKIGVKCTARKTFAIGFNKNILKIKFPT
jgi:spore coat protein U-like protein